MYENDFKGKSYNCLHVCLYENSLKSIENGNALGVLVIRTESLEFVVHKKAGKTLIENMPTDSV